MANSAEVHRFPKRMGRHSLLLKNAISPKHPINSEKKSVRAISTFRKFVNAGALARNYFCARVIDLNLERAIQIYIVLVLAFLRFRQCDFRQQLVNNLSRKTTPPVLPMPNRFGGRRIGGETVFDVEIRRRFPAF